MARNRQISRIYNLLIIMEFAPHGLTVKELASRLSERGHTVAVRTVYRDLIALQGAGFPISEHGTDADNGKRWVLGRRSKITRYGLVSAEEMQTLAKILSVVLALPEFHNEDRVRSFAGKLMSQITPDASVSHC